MTVLLTPASKNSPHSGGREAADADGEVDHAPAPPVGTISNGTCGATSVVPDCNTAPKGSFPGMATMAACVAKLKGCKMANYASFSPPPPLGWNDCSWYSTCDFQHLCTGGCPTLPGPSPAGCPTLPKLKCSFTSETIKLPVLNTRPGACPRY